MFSEPTFYCGMCLYHDFEQRALVENTIKGWLNAQHSPPHGFLHSICASCESRQWQSSSAHVQTNCEHKLNPLPLWAVHAKCRRPRFSMLKKVGLMHV